MLERNPPGRIPELDGLRGTAIFFVLMYHYTQRQPTADPHIFRFYLENLFLIGWSGVDLFFVLSGFLIGGILLDARDSASYFKTFYMRRFFRIIPIYYAWIFTYILIVSVAGAALVARYGSGAITKPGFAIYGHFLFLQNLAVIPLAGLARPWFISLWSLAVEEQFYLVSPLVVRLFSRRDLGVFLVAAIVGAPLLRIALLLGTHIDGQLVYVLMPCRADSLAIGMLAALLWREPHFRKWLSSNTRILYGTLAVLLAGVAALWRWSPFNASWGMESVGYTCLAFLYVLILLLALTTPGGPIARLARVRWLRELGRVSYCMYIIHAVVDVVCHALLRRAPPAISDWRGMGVTVFAGFATYVVAWLSWKFFEGPMLRLGHGFKYS
jgi:peptidoglycan/LPS O-acetylase OafA/YrhL